MYVLVDTSVWIKHLHKPNEALISFLNSRLVLSHSAVIGELACGHLPRRKEILHDLHLLPKANEASLEEVLQMLEHRKLFGRGLGFIDMQLLASATLSEATLMTYDKKLARFT